jgi:hypothetical protein
MKHFTIEFISEPYCLNFTNIIKSYLSGLLN